MIKISVIIPSFNQGNYLEETILSVVNQRYPKTEIIIMDGGSTDNSVEIIKKYEDHIYYWRSEKDNGQSEAINSGFRIATGEFVTWLNSDDVFMPGTLFKVNEYAERYPNVDWFLGCLFWIDKDGKIIHVGKAEKENKFVNSHYYITSGGPSAFMRKSRLIEVGMLREDYHYMMDTELYFRYISKGLLFKRIDHYCWGFRCHETSKTTAEMFTPEVDTNSMQYLQRKKENHEMFSLYTKPKWIRFIFLLLKLFDRNVFTRILDKKYIGLNYKNIGV